MTYADKLNPEQKKAVEHQKGPLLIVAGAGTGKTTVICERINYLITQKNLGANEILALTFTEKAAAEMEERVDKVLPYGINDLWISTFHSFAERVLREHGLDIGLTTDFKLLDETAAWVLIRNNLEKFNLDYYKPLGNPSKFIKALLKHFSKCKDEIVTPKDYLDYAESYRLDNDLSSASARSTSLGATANITADQMEIASEAKRLEELANAYHTYQQLMLDNNYLDFGDLLNYCYELFLKRPKILKKYQEQFKYILVDEFQDTNYAQYQLVKLLSQPENNITVVGDDDQSIYKFRGASISNILEFKKDFPKSKEIFLTANYRSRQNILDVSYKFIQLNNPNRLEVKLQVGQAGAVPSGKSGSAKKLSKELKAAAKGKGIIEHLHLPAIQDEVASVVNKIGELYQKDEGQSFNHFAILVRANNQAKPFIEGLELAGIPYQYVASRGLYAKPIILNLIAFLKLLDNYHESDAMYRYLTLPIFSLLQEEIIRITHEAYKKSWTLFETVRQARLWLRLRDKSYQELDRAVSYVERYMARSKTEKTSRIVFDFLNESGYLKQIDTLSELEKRQQFSYLGQFYKKIKVFEELEDDKSTKHFLERLGLELEAGEQGDLVPLTEDEGPEMVKVMTIHQAKGLEFKYVFIVNLVAERFPTRERGEQIELPDKVVKEIVPEGDIHLQEERRLFYVALTRAKEGLFLTSAEDYGGVRKKKISVFLTDLGFKESQTGLSAPKKGYEEKLEKIMPVSKNQKPNPLTEFLPAKFSFTQIKDFQSCPRMYYYRYILKVPMKGSHYFSFGSTIHLTLQKFYEEAKRRQAPKQTNLFSGVSSSETGGLSATLGTGSLAALKNKSSIFSQGIEPSKKNFHNATPWQDTRVLEKMLDKSLKESVSLEELLKLYEGAWIDDWYQNKGQKEEYFKLGKEILRNFYNSRYLEESMPVYLEKMFSLRLGNYTLVGKIDRLDRFKNGLKIIDYKTGRPKEKLEAEDKEQLLIYQMAARSLFNEPVTELAYYYLENGTQVPFLGSDKEIAKLEEKIAGTIARIKNFDFNGFMATHGQCDFCKEVI